jgi:DNA-binding transcriptional ArsR family regulator
MLSAGRRAVEVSTGASRGHTPPLRRHLAREPFPKQVVELTAQRLQVVAKAKRIVLLEALKDGEAGVQELADRVGLPHQNASHHLTLLWQAGILSRRSEGTMTLYVIEDWSAWWVVEQIARWVRSGLDDRDAQAPAK